MANIDDPLLTILLKLCEIHHHPTTAQALAAGLPLVNNMLTPQLFIRAAERNGFIAKIKEQPIEKISSVVLPVVLLLKNSGACILKKLIDETKVEIISSEFIDTSQIVNLDELKNLYTGYAIYIHPVAQFTDAATEKNKSWFWGTLWEFRSTYYEVIFGAFLINLFTLASPLFVMNVYDRVVPNNATLTLWVLTIGMLVILLFDLLLRFLRSYLIDINGKKADVIIASRLFSEVLNIQLVKKPKSTGELVNTLREFESVRDFITSSTLTTLIDLPFVVIFIIFIAYLSLPLAIIPIIAIPILLGMAWLIEKPLSKVVKDANQASAKKNGILFENLSGLEIIKSMNAQGVAQSKWENIVGLSSQLNLRSRFISGSMVNITYYIQQMVTVLTVVIGVYEIANGTLSLGGLIACSILAGRAIAPLGQFANIITRFQQARSALTDLNQLMEKAGERVNPQIYLKRPEIRGDIEFKDVQFSYPDQPTPALTNINFKINAGERVAILGHIGSGKTTIQKLLLKLYEPQKGAIYLDGVDINQLDPVDIRKSMGYVPQEVLLFAGTLRDNIALSLPWADDATVLHAVEISGANQFISKHPMGFNMLVGERGEGLSGGQRQLISITRAFLTDPQILLLDEPTSSMDDAAEQQLIKNITDYLQPKTLLLVTHRFSLLALVNRIILIDNGKIILDGPKEKVLETLTKSQAQANQPKA